MARVVDDVKNWMNMFRWIVKLIRDEFGVDEKLLVRTATLDGSRGENGLVTLPLDNWLAAHPASPAVFFACGPYGMLRAVAERAASVLAPGWVSLDKHMVCGVGACLACVQRMRRPDGATWIARVCRDGPVFPAAEVVWEEPK